MLPGWVLPKMKPISGQELNTRQITYLRVIMPNIFLLNGHNIKPPPNDLSLNSEIKAVLNFTMEAIIFRR